MIRSDFFSKRNALSIKEIYDILHLEYPEGIDLQQVFTGVAALNNATQNDVCVLHNGKYVKDAQKTNAGLCITTSILAHHVGPYSHVIYHPAPYRAYAAIASALFPKMTPQNGVHPTAVLHPTAQIGENCEIGAYAVIGKDVKIGKNTYIGSHTSIDAFVTIGDDSYIDCHVTISHAHIGTKAYIKPGTRIGQQGFGFHMDDKGHFDVPQLGIVEIGHDVQIGANVCIDRGSIGNTIICDGVRIDNLVQIAHNVYVGQMSVIVAQAGIAGSTRLGKFVVLAGQVGLAGHLTIGDFVKVAAQSGLMRDVKEGETVAGSPAVSVRDWHKQTILLKNLIKEETPHVTKRAR